MNSQKNNTIRFLLEWATRELNHVSSTPRLDAELLLCAVGNWSRTTLIAFGDDRVNHPQLLQFESYIERRKQYEPVAYILGEKEFWGLKFKVTPDVLVPRPETELIVEESLKFVDGLSGDLKILDLGTGSGCLAVAIGSELRDLGRTFACTAVDISPKALEVAAENIEIHNLREQITLVESDWFTDISSSFDLIVCNPPYVNCEVEQSPSISFEPEGALFSEEEGTQDVDLLLNEIPKFLKLGGRALVEIGSDQGYFAKQYGCELLKDLAGLDRVLRVSKSKA